MRIIVTLYGLAQENGSVSQKVKYFKVRAINSHLISVCSYIFFKVMNTLKYVIFELAMLYYLFRIDTGIIT